MFTTGAIGALNNVASRQARVVAALKRVSAGYEHGSTEQAQVVALGNVSKPKGPLN